MLLILVGVAVIGSGAGDAGLRSSKSAGGTLAVGAGVGSMGTAHDFLLATLAAPTISGFSPSSGPVGTSVTITGTGFTGATGVSFSGTAASSFTVNSDTQVTAVVPSGAGSGSISVTTPSGTASSGSGSVSFVSVGVSSLTAGSTSLSVALPSGYQAGDLLVAWLSFADNAQSITGMTGWTEFPWSPLDDGTAWHVRAFYKIAVSGETAPTVQWTNSTKALFETGAWRGVDTANPIAASGGALNLTSGASVAGPPVSNPSASAWAVGFFSYRTTTSTDKATSFSSFSPAGLTERADANISAGASAAWVNAATVDSAGPVGTGSHQYTGTTTGTSGSSHKAASLLYVAPGGGGGSFTVTASPPTVTGFSPTSGPVGTSVTITGTGFTGATAVKFNGTSATSFTVNSATQVTATVPTGATSGTVSVTTAGGTGTSANSFTVAASAPTVTGFSPTSGPVGTSVTITGTGFTGATGVAFNGTAATSFTVNSATQITAAVPTGATSGQISVTTAAGTGTSTNSFTVGAAGPTVTGFSPTSGAVGASVTITGTGFTGATGVAFNGTAATSFTVNSATQITATVPTGATSGPISVTTAAGTGTSTNSFTVGAGPTVTGFSPTSGAVGASVTITGTGFTGATGVSFNGTAATSFTVNSATQITAAVPTGAASGPISVTTPAGTGTSTNSFTVSGASPTITGFSPTSGQVGTSVTITGTGFTGATGVAFNGTAASSFTVNSGTQITATVPTGATSGPITVTTPSGTASSSTGGSGAVSFVSVGVSRLTSGSTSLALALPSGYQAGDLLVAWLSFSDNAQSITGMTGWTAFPWSSLDDGTLWHVRAFYKIAVAGEPAPTVRWTNGSKALFETGAWRGVNSANPIAASGGALNLTSGASVVGPSVSNPSASDLAVAFFTYRSTSTGSKSATFSLYSPAGLTERADANLSAASSAAFLTVATTDSAGPISTGSHQYTATSTGSSSSHKAAALVYLAPGSSGAFTVTAPPPPPPTVSGFSPTSGPVGTSVTITGTGFTGATGVSFNGTPATTFTVNSATQVTATVPTGATTGPVSVTTGGGTGTSTNSFTVTGPPPTITGFAPTSGPEGTSVTITGTGFTGATSVLFNGSPTTFTVNSATQITAVVPTGATSGPIDVITPNGTAVSSTSFTVGVSTSTYSVYVGYYDTHHPDFTKPKPDPWINSPNVVFVGKPDSSSGPWTSDSSAVRVDNLSGGSLTNVVVTVDIGSHHYGLWSAQTIPAGYSLILAGTAFENFDGSDTNPAGCYGCDPALCTAMIQTTIPVVHVTVNGVQTNFSDTHQYLNTFGVDSAGCPDTGDVTVRRDESQVWQQIG